MIFEVIANADQVFTMFPCYILNIPSHTINTNPKHDSFFVEIEAQQGCGSSRVSHPVREETEDLKARDIKPCGELCILHFIHRQISQEKKIIYLKFNTLYFLFFLIFKPLSRH